MDGNRITLISFYELCYEIVSLPEYVFYVRNTVLLPETFTYFFYGKM